ncbi:MAG TPA: hypothetical protein VJQ79_12795 [Acidimicrobiia bacterium]|nr:hypothetical protein [Acidimicrobiia bacterium]
MSRLDASALTAAAVKALGAEPDPTGAADLVWNRGKVVVAAEAEGLKAAFDRLKKIDGYRWLVINREDLFAANSLSIGSKAGIVDPHGNVLKAPDIPRRNV